MPGAISKTSQEAARITDATSPIHHRYNTETTPQANKQLKRANTSRMEQLLVFKQTSEVACVDDDRVLKANSIFKTIKRN